MKTRKIIWRVVLVIAMATGCSGGGSSSTDSQEPTSEITVQQRIDAAAGTVENNSACTSITPFYWEIGDTDGLLASGTGGNDAATAPNADTLMQIASASKWIFAAFALEQTPYPQIQNNGDIDYLNFTSGYDNMGILSCLFQDTVGDCFNAASTNGGRNSDFHAEDVGRFYYGSGHLQAYATDVAGLGGYYDTDSGGTPALATAIRAQLGEDISIEYSNPVLAGGIRSTAESYAKFLRKILAGSLAISDYLNAARVCAWTNLDDCDALYSPINQTKFGPTNDISDEKWHYSLGHWVEDDPTVGDGAYSSPGLFGFYPWIDSNQTYYGVLARHDTNIAPSDPKQAPDYTSVNCGRLIRKAWLQGVEQ